MNCQHKDELIVNGVDAMIVSATVNDDGTVTLGLAMRNDGTAPVDTTSLTVTNPPDNPYLMTTAVGCDIWSKGPHIYMSDMPWALRVGTKKIRLVPKKV